MKFTINSTDLSKALDRVIKFVPARSLMPILTNIKLSATDRGILLLTSFDLSNGIELEIECEVLGAGDVCVPAQLFNAVAKGLKGQIVLELNGDILTISSLSGTCEIQCQSSEEFPSFLQDDRERRSNSIESTINAKSLSQIVKLCTSSVSIDETKSILTGINFVSKDGVLTAASTDGHRLTVVKVPIDDGVNIESVNIKPKSISAIDDEGEVYLSFDESVCSISADRLNLLCRPIAGKYPDYQLLIPKSFKSKLELDRRDLIDALNLMATLDPENSLVRVSIDNNKIIVRSIKGGNQAIRSIDCEFVGQNSIDLGFNQKYLLTAIKTIPTDRVKISLNDPLSPVILRPVDSDLDLLCLVMPLQIRE